MCRSVVTTHETKDQTRRNAELTIITEESENSNAGHFSWTQTFWTNFAMFYITACSACRQSALLTAGF